MFKHIMVCLDGSELAEQILPYATAQSRRFESKVSLVHVLTASEVLIVPTTPTGEPIPGASQVSNEKVNREMKDTEDYLANIAGQMKNEGVDARPVILIEPFAGTAMVEYAARNGIGLIAIATHGRTGLRRAMSGSVAEEMLRESHLPVLLVRPRVIES